MTNGTYSGDTTITDTATVTITANSGYTLPDTVTVTGATQSWNKETGTLTLSNPTGAVTVEAACVAAVTYPVKGDLITLDNKTYRVLKVDGSVAEVLPMYDASSVAFDTNPNYNYTNTYVNKNIDTYCNNTFYDGLSSAVKFAIVDKTFAQDSWKFVDSYPTEEHYTGLKGNGKTYYLILSNTHYSENITRHCYCLSIQDVLDYVGATTNMNSSNTTLTSTNIWVMFWNRETTQQQNIWLSSARAYSNSNYAFCVTGDFGFLDYNSVSINKVVRPAFQIDLSKIEWTKQ